MYDLSFRDRVELLPTMANKHAIHQDDIARQSYLGPIWNSNENIH